MKQLYITILLALASSFAFAQQDFRQGYIVQNGDTTSGLVDYRGAQRNTHQISFKSSTAAEEQNFTPTQVQGYGFNKEQKFYESKLVPAFDTLSVEQTLFAQLLVKGKANLYFLRDPMQKDRFYISKEGSEIKELRVEEYKRTDAKTGRSYAMRRELHKPILMQTFFDCSSIKEADVDKVVIGINSLSDIVQKYNQCAGLEEYIKPEQKISLDFGAVAGISSSTLTYTIEDKDQNYNNKSVKPVLGAFMNISFPTFSEKLSLQMEMLYAPNYFEASVGDDPSVPGFTTRENKIDLKHLKVPTLIRYTFPRGTIRPFLNVGPTWSFIIAQKNESLKTTTIGGTTRTSTEPVLEDDEFRNLTIGITAGAGISYYLFNKLFTLEARYEKNRGITNLKGETSNIQSLSLQLSYKL